MKIDIGCGNKTKPGFIGIDFDLNSNAEIIHDINNGLPFDNNSIDEIYSSHFIEHCENPLFLFDEIHRVCKNNTEITIIVPLFEYISNDHLHLFQPGYFHRNIDNNKFKVEHIEIIELPNTVNGLTYWYFQKTLKLTVIK